MGRDAFGNYIPSATPAPSWSQPTPAFSPLSGEGSPIGIETPQFIGQLYHDTTADTYYRSTGLTSADWTAISGGGSPAANKQGSGDPGIGLTPDFIGQVYRDTATGNIWRANSTTPGDWTLEVQDMQVVWEPTNTKAGESLGFFTYGDIPQTKLQFLGTTSLAGFDIESTTTPTEIDFPNLVSIDPLNTQGGVINISNNSSVSTISLPSLVSVALYVSVYSNDSLPIVSAPSLVSIGGQLTIYSNSSLLSISMQNLVTVGTYADCSDNPLLSAVDFSSLTTVASYVDFTNDISLAAIIAPSLQAIGGNLIGAIGSPLTSLNLPSLATIGGSFNWGGCSDLDAISLPVLSTVALNFNCNSNDILDTLSLPSLTSVGGYFDSDSNTLLATLSAPLLVSIGGNVIVNLNPALTTVDWSSWIPTDGTSITFAGCALNAASVQLILRRLVLAGVTTCTIDLSGGTNAGTASLNAQGQADVVTLGAQLVGINP